MCECGLAAGAGNPPRLAKHMNPMPPRAPVEVARAKQRRHLTRCLASERCVNTIQGWVGGDATPEGERGRRVTVLADRQSSSGKREAWASPAIFGGSVPRRSVSAIFAGWPGCSPRRSPSWPRAGSPRPSSAARGLRCLCRSDPRRQLRPRSSLKHGSGLAAKVQVPAIDR